MVKTGTQQRLEDNKQYIGTLWRHTAKAAAHGHPRDRIFAVVRVDEDGYLVAWKCADLGNGQIGHPMTGYRPVPPGYDLCCNGSGACQPTATFKPDSFYEQVNTTDPGFRLVLLPENSEEPLLERGAAGILERDLPNGAHDVVSIEYLGETFIHQGTQNGVITFRGTGKVNLDHLADPYTRGRFTAEAWLKSLDSKEADAIWAFLDGTPNLASDMIDTLIAGHPELVPDYALTEAG